MRCTVSSREHTQLFPAALWSIVVAGAGLGLAGAPQQAELHPVIDSAVRPAVGPALHPPTTLIAPHIAATKVDLEPTVVPEWRFIQASDLNGDGVVDADDVLLMISSFGPCEVGEHCRADLTGSRIVNEEDLAVLIQYLGQQYSAPPFDEVGYVSEPPPNLIAAAPKHQLDDDSQVIRLELQSKDAKGLRVQLDGWRVSSGIMLRVYDPAPGATAVLGPYSSARADSEGKWWTPTVFGDSIGLEILIPAGIDDVLDAQLMPLISGIASYYCAANCHDDFPPGTPLGCHNDAVCHPSWSDAEGRAVATIYFVTGASCGQCSGALMNRAPNDLVPLFMTANHCVSTPEQADSLEAFWFYENETCDGDDAPDINDVPRNNGSLILKRHVNTDWTLLGLYEPAQSNSFIGSNPNAWASGDDATGIHHPRASFKRISFGESDGSTNNQTFCDPGGVNCFDANVWNVSYTSGTAEPGSSGSPIFDSDRLMRGTLSGGQSGCPDPTVTMQYGRYDQAYTNLRYFVQDISSPVVFVDSTVSGDPGNNGNSEKGTSANPFNTVFEATFAVISGDEVRIAAGNYNEHMTIWRPMTISADGGLVRIGAP